MMYHEITFAPYFRPRTHLLIVMCEIENERGLPKDVATRYHADRWLSFAYETTYERETVARYDV